MSLSHLISRLTVCAPKVCAAIQSARNFSLNSLLLIQPTQCLYKEPIKKRRKLDPGQLKLKEEKRKRKIEKEIKRLGKYSQTLKPIEEMQLPLHIQDQYEKRQREEPNLSPEEVERRALLMKEWSRQRLKEHKADLKMLDRIIYSQQLALDKLREESEELYQAAIQVDENLIPISIKGPTLTPPIKDYDSPDGDYNNTSFKWN